jgi:pilus assembly protein Flp/PilA
MLQMIIARLRKLAKNEEGVTAMEYGLIAAATVVAIAALMPGIGTALSTIFSTISHAL